MKCISRDISVVCRDGIADLTSIKSSLRNMDTKLCARDERVLRPISILMYPSIFVKILSWRGLPGYYSGAG